MTLGVIFLFQRQHQFSYHIIMPIIIFLIFNSAWLTTNFVLIFFIPLGQVYCPPKGTVAQSVAWLVALKTLPMCWSGIWISGLRGLFGIHHFLFSYSLIFFKSISMWFCLSNCHRVINMCLGIFTTIISSRRIIPPSVLQQKFGLQSHILGFM